MPRTKKVRMEDELPLVDGKPVCKFCNATDVVANGTKPNYQRWMCNICRKIFYTTLKQLDQDIKLNDLIVMILASAKEKLTGTGRLS